MVADRVATLTRDSAWKPVMSVPIAFRTFHPQGMVKIGDTLFVSSVEVRCRPSVPQPVGGTTATPAKASAICSSSI